MGDRGVIVVEQHGDTDPVVLYTHWRASQLPEILTEALAHNKRWGDPSYLTRIIFDHISERAREFTGAGITTSIPGDAWRVIRVDPLADIEDDELHGHIEFDEGQGFATDKHGGEEFDFTAFIESFGSETTTIEAE